MRASRVTAIENPEDSFKHNRPRALVQMATGSGKTYTAITSVYRLLKHADAKRIFFLVDTLLCNAWRIRVTICDSFSSDEGSGRTNCIRRGITIESAGSPRSFGKLERFAFAIGTTGGSGIV